MIRRLLLALPAYTLSIVCFLAILYLTLMPDPLQGQEIVLFPGADKVVHAIMMAGMMWCLALDMLRKKAAHDLRETVCRVPLLQLAIMFFAVAIFGGAIELIQGAMACGRGEDFYDFLADVAGDVIALISSIAAWGTVWRYLQQGR